MADRRDCVLRAVRFERPERIPVNFSFNPSCWYHSPAAELWQVIEAYPWVFPSYRVPADQSQRPFEDLRPVATPGEWRDPWGSVWMTTEPGITGTVIEHALADWAALEDFVAPDPALTDGCDPMDWAALAVAVAEAKAAGDLVHLHLNHGHTFLRLCDLRGYENLVFDMMDDEPRLWRLIERIEAFNLGVVERMVALQPDLLGYPEDLGMQVGPMLAPEQYRRFIRPSIERLMQPAIEAGILIHKHSDGDIRTLVDDLLLAGVQALNCQDLVNGIDWLAEQVKGRVCIDLDVDRQQVVRFGSPQAVDSLVRQEVETLGSAEGGLMFRVDMYPGVPLENIHALAAALDRYSTHWS